MSIFHETWVLRILSYIGVIPTKLIEMLRSITYSVTPCHTIHTIVFSTQKDNSIQWWTLLDWKMDGWASCHQWNDKQLHSWYCLLRKHWTSFSLYNSCVNWLHRVWRGKFNTDTPLCANTVEWNVHYSDSLEPEGSDWLSPECKRQNVPVSQNDIHAKHHWRVLPWVCDRCGISHFVHVCVTANIFFKFIFSFSFIFTTCAFTYTVQSNRTELVLLFHASLII